MTTIIVSADVPGIGERSAEQTAEALGFDYLGPSILGEIAGDRGVDEADLRRVLDPTQYRRVGKKTRQLLLSYIAAETLTRLQPDNIVCAGLGAHLYTHDVSHILMLRILYGRRARIAEVIKKRHVLEPKATKIVTKERMERTRWSTECFGIDEADAAHYDLVIRMGQIEIEKLIEITKDMAGYRKFQPMSYSRKCLNDLTLAAQVRTLLLPHHSDIKVRANGDTVVVHVKCAKRNRQKVTLSVKEIASQIEGVSLVEVHGVSKLP